MVIVGWSAFILSWLLNILYYRLHPAEVDWTNLANKIEIFIFGKKGRHYQTEKNASSPLNISVWSSKNKHRQEEQNNNKDMMSTDLEEAISMET